MRSIKTTLAKAGINTFFFLLVLSILLAYLFPEIGSTGSWIPLDGITYYGVAIIFFFYGVKISPGALKAGLANWKLHLLVQVSTFLFFPAVILTLLAIWGNEQSPLWIGTFYLAALPSTVSSSVVMVSIAKGNLPAAIFNASVSSILGIFITPIWMSLYLTGADGDYQLTDTIYKLIVQVLIPVLVGFSLHRYLGEWVAAQQKWLKNFDQSIILLIVFSAFANSFAEKMFEGQSLQALVVLSALMLLFFLAMMGLMYGLSRLMSFSYADRVTVLFCGSKKSLVQGAVMGKILFPDPVVFGVVLLPLMIYHTQQLIVGSALAERLGARHQSHK
ncbi:MAG: bile acid:sodium symporter [Lunatimonas sp.]|uniref:bile acid:sodium symporter family protein n=1 Tax=Lunatimonas sp. TaxID=2060141 RepID=UPI00263A4FBF|nr:bile acid:sodium symporter family protein [Lunatimonas sp.]MCC5937949.1 bile acid:sodium symporter [Lunatimonas sp.]